MPVLDGGRDPPDILLRRRITRLHLGRRADGCRYRLQRLAPASTQDDPGPLLRQRLGRRLADAAAGTRHPGDLSFELAHRVSPLVRHIASSIRNGPGAGTSCAADRPALPSVSVARRLDAHAARRAGTQSRSGLPRSIMSIAVRPGLAPTCASSPSRIAYLRLDRMTVVTGSFSRAWVHKRLHRVHGRAVGLQVDHPPARRADGGTGGQRQAAADGAAGDLQPVMRRGGMRPAEEAAAEAHALVDDDRSFRHQRRQRQRPPSRRGRRTALADVGPGRRDRHRRRRQLLGQPCQRLRQVLLGPGQHVQMRHPAASAGAACSG